MHIIHYVYVTCHIQCNHIEFCIHSVTPSSFLHFAERRSKLEKFSHQAKNWSLWCDRSWLGETHGMKSAHVHDQDMSSTAGTDLCFQNYCKIWSSFPELLPFFRGLISHIFWPNRFPKPVLVSTSARPSGWSVPPGWCTQTLPDCWVGRWISTQNTGDFQGQTGTQYLQLEPNFWILHVWRFLESYIWVIQIQNSEKCTSSYPLVI